MAAARLNDDGHSTAVQWQMQQRQLQLLLPDGSRTAFSIQTDEPLDAVMRRAGAVLGVPAEALVVVEGARVGSHGAGVMRLSLRIRGGGCGCSTPAGPTDWAEQGGEELEAMLASGSIALLDAQWVVDLSERGGVLAPRQALPPEAFLSLSSLKAATLRKHHLPLVCVSHCWLQPDHPDPHGFYLAKLADALRLLIGSDPLGGKHAVFYAFSSLHQPCRNAEGAPRPFLFPLIADQQTYEGGALGRFASEEALFARALGGVSALFSHPRSFVFLLTALPPDYDSPGAYRRSPNTAPYHNRGWCLCEFSLATLVKETAMVLDLCAAGRAAPEKKTERGQGGGAEEGQEGGAEGRVEGGQEGGAGGEMGEGGSARGAGGREPPTRPNSQSGLAPPDTTEGEDTHQGVQLGSVKANTDGGRACEHWYDLLSRCRQERRAPLTPDSFEARLRSAGFTNDADRERVAQLYRVGFQSRLGAATELSYQRLGWGAGEAAAVADVLKMGAAPKLTELDLSFNAIGDAGAAALAEALPFATTLEKLNLCENGLGDFGAATLAAALPHMPKLNWLNLHGNGIGDAGAKALAEALPRCGALRWVNLYSNKRIGNEGLKALWAGASSRHTLRLMAPERQV